MRYLRLLFLLLIISNNVEGQSELIWSSDFQLSSTFGGRNPMITFENDTIHILDRVFLDGQSTLLSLQYNLNGELMNTVEIRNDNNGGVDSFGPIKYTNDQSRNYYIAQYKYIAENKDDLIISRFNKDGDMNWTTELSSLGDTSYAITQMSLLGDSLLLVNYEETFDYMFDPDNYPDNLVFEQKNIMSCYHHANGELLWNIELDEKDIIYKILKTTDGWLLFETTIEATYVTRIIKLEMNGAQSVLQEYNELIQFQNVQINNNNELIFASVLGYEFHILNLADGEIQSYEYPADIPSSTSSDKIESIFQDGNGNIYVTGKHYGADEGTNCDVLTLKFNAAGELSWENRYMYGLDNCELGKVLDVKDDYVYIGGISANSGTPSPYDYLVLKLAAGTGNNVGIYRYDAGEDSDDNISDLLVLEDGSIILTGTTDASGFPAEPPYWTTQYLSDVILSTNNYNDNYEINISPNPIASGTPLKVSANLDFHNFSIHSVVGNLCHSGTISNVQNFEIKMPQLNPGIYFISLHSDQAFASRKFVVN